MIPALISLYCNNRLAYGNNVTEALPSHGYNTITDSKRRAVRIIIKKKRLADRILPVNDPVPIRHNIKEDTYET